MSDNLTPQTEIAALGARPVVLVGLMGAGKTSVGRALADLMGRSFVDSDHEIERAADLTIPEIFEKFGESHFRDGESRVIARLLTQENIILATGGGAFMTPKIRDAIAEAGVSVWLKADVSTLWNRVRGKPGRPLLQQPDPQDVLRNLAEIRDPVYATADITIDTGPSQSAEAVAQAILAALQERVPS